MSSIFVTLTSLICSPPGQCAFSEEREGAEKKQAAPERCPVRTLRGLGRCCHLRGAGATELRLELGFVDAAQVAFLGIERGHEEERRLLAQMAARRDDGAVLSGQRKRDDGVVRSRRLAAKGDILALGSGDLFHPFA